jgi:hypothetical protein
MNTNSNEEKWEQIQPMITMQGLLAYSLVYLWKRFLDNYPDPVPNKWHAYSALSIIEWCKADAKEQQKQEARMDKMEAEFPTMGKG